MNKKFIGIVLLYVKSKPQCMKNEETARQKKHKLPPKLLSQNHAKIGHITITFPLKDPNTHLIS